MKTLTRSSCSVPGCTGRYAGRGWCSTHYKRAQNHGDVGEPGVSVCSTAGCLGAAVDDGLCSRCLLTFGQRLLDPKLERRFFEHVDFQGPLAHQRPDLGRCWLWTGTRDLFGYPQFSRLGQTVTGRKASWEIAAGRVAPPGLRFYMFACEGQLCVNPAHIRPIIGAGLDDGNYRWLAGYYASLVERASADDSVAYCLEGHALRVPEGVLIVPGGYDCRICRREAERASSQKRAGRAV